MLIDGGCCLRTAVAVGVVEIERGDAMLTEGTGEGGTAAHRFGCVISHVFNVIVVLVACADLGQWVRDLRAGTTATVSRGERR